MKFGNGPCLGENDFQAVAEAGTRALGPGDRSFRGKRGNRGGNFLGAGSHHAASLVAFAGARKTMARFCGARYFLATR